MLHEITDSCKRLFQRFGIRPNGKGYTFEKEMSSLRMSHAIRSRKIVILSNASGCPFEKIVIRSNGSGYPFKPIANRATVPNHFFHPSRLRRTCQKMWAYYK